MVGLVVLVVSEGTPFPMGVAKGSPSSGTLVKLLNSLSFCPLHGGGGNCSWGSVMFPACVQRESSVAGSGNTEVNHYPLVPSDGDRQQVKKVVSRMTPGCAKGSTGVNGC